MRIRELPGTIVPSAALRAKPAGAYAFAPAGTPMFAASPDGAVVQVHGVGPFHIHWRDGLASLADGDTAAFRLRIGDRVGGARGAGVVRAGYAKVVATGRRALHAGPAPPHPGAPST